MTPGTHEVNFDGLVGPTHNYAGLSAGNIASMTHGGTLSHPKEAALQGLRKMKLLLDLGVKQAVVPPQERPDLETLRRLGFGGDPARALRRARREDPALWAACWSASSMWTANAATVSPSADTADGRVHFTPANLVSQFHRSLEAETTARFLETLFPDETLFARHPPLPAGLRFRDEGAANHARFCRRHEEPGIELFVYGREASEAASRRFQARQTKEASAAVARMHRLKPERTVLVRQNPGAVDSGAFHNDVVAVGNCGVFLFHERAFDGGPAALEELRRKYARQAGEELALIAVDSRRLSLADAVALYLFNSQLVSVADGTMCLIAPSECEENARARRILEEIVQGDNPIDAVRFVDIRQSMKNGGGPACLRLRVVLTESELERMHAPLLLTDSLHQELVGWVERHYRDRLDPDALADPGLIGEVRAALDELTRILRLGSLYRFQRAG